MDTKTMLFANFCRDAYYHMSIQYYKFLVAKLQTPIFLHLQNQFKNMV